MFESRNNCRFRWDNTVCIMWEPKEKAKEISKFRQSLEAFFTRIFSYFPLYCLLGASFQSNKQNLDYWSRNMEGLHLLLVHIIGLTRFVYCYPADITNKQATLMFPHYCVCYSFWTSAHFSARLASVSSFANLLAVCGLSDERFEWFELQWSHFFPFPMPTELTSMEKRPSLYETTHTRPCFSHMFLDSLSLSLIRRDKCECMWKHHGIGVCFGKSKMVNDRELNRLIHGKETSVFLATIRYSLNK